MRFPLIVDYHIGREITVNTVMVGTWLLCIYLFINLLDLMEDVRIEDQLDYVFQVLALSIPRMMYELAPMVLLIGTILASAKLSRSNELVALQASGVSKYRIATSMVGYSVVAAILMLLWGELVVPKSEIWQDQVKVSQDSKLSAQPAKDGLWYRDKNQFINVTLTLKEDTLGNIDIFHFDDQGRLVKLTNAAGGVINTEENTLKLFGVTESVLENRRIVQQVTESKDYRIEAELKVIGAHERDTAQLTILDLYRAANFLQVNGLKTEFIDLAFWNRIIMPISLLVMALFALLFTYKIRPRVNNGHLVFIGLMFGLLYFALQQSVGYITMLNGLQPIVGTLSAFLAFLLAAIISLVRI